MRCHSGIAASRFLRDGGYTNVIIEVCNEMGVDKDHPIIHQPEGMAVLKEIAREASGGLPVGCSGGGGSSFEEVNLQLPRRIGSMRES